MATKDPAKLIAKNKKINELHKEFRQKMKDEGKVSVDSYYLKDDLVEIKKQAREKYPDLRISDAVGKLVTDVFFGR